LLQDYFFDLPKLFEELLNVCLAETELVRNGDPQDANRLLIVLFQLVYDAVDRSILVNKCVLEVLE